MEPVRYHVSIEDPHAHHFLVSATFPGPFEGGALEVFLPTWTPGSYLQREFARNILQERAEDERGPLTMVKTGKATWRIEAGKASAVTIRLRIYANELSVRTSHLDGTHAFFNGANLFLTRAETRNVPAKLDIDAPAGWKVATTLPEAPGGGWLAEDYDHLVDCPVEMGTHRSLRFEVEGVPHEVVIWGEGNFDEAPLLADLAKIARAQGKLMGGFPFRRYLYIVHLSDKGRGGLEHRDCTALLYPRFGFRPHKEYEEFLRLASHEYFHAWNVKSIKPKAFDPYDYRRENYTSLLWAMEGFTEYYEVMALTRAGLLSRERTLAIWGEEITALLRTPGRKVQSLAQSSFDSWIKYYRQDENSPNAGVSYYRKGALVALAFDMELRARTGGKKSLDDLMRLMLERHGSKGHGAPEDAYRKALVELGGEGLAPLFDRYVEGIEEIDFAGHLAHAGLVFRTRAAESHDDKGGSAGKRAKKKEGEPEEPHVPLWIGFDARAERGRTVITHVHTDSPALHAGIYAGDELVAVDGWRADEKAWRARLAERSAGQRAKLTLFRRDRLVEVILDAVPAPEDTAWIEVAVVPPPGAKALLDSWMGS